MEAQQEQEWLSTEEAAARLSKTDRQVRRDVNEGRLVGRKKGRKLFVDAVSVAALAQEKMASEITEEKEEEDATVGRPHEAEGLGTREEDIGDQVAPAEGDVEELASAEADEEAPGNGRADGAGVCDKGQGGIQSEALAASREELDQLFQDIRVMVDLHLRRVQDFHRAMHERIDHLEERLVFERGRNEEVQKGLAKIQQGRVYSNKGT